MRNAWVISCSMVYQPTSPELVEQPFDLDLDLDLS